MVVYDSFIWEDGRELVKAYSDKNMYIRQDETGLLYAEATDPADMRRTYTETDIPIEEEDEADDESE